MKRYIKDGIIKTRNQIVIKGQRTIKDKDGNEKVVNTNTYNPTEEMILADGWVEYVPHVPPAPPVVEPSEPNKSRRQVMEEIVLEQYNSRTDISDEDALERSIVIFDWQHYIGSTLNAGQCVVYLNVVYRVKQTHEVQEQYPPSIDTASLYTEVNLVDDGTIDNPIPYNNNMALENGKYYIQDGIKYLCIRDTGNPVYNPLKDLVGIYVEVVTE